MIVELQEISKVIMGQSPKGESYNDEKIGLPLLNGAADYKGKVFKPKYYTSEPTRTAKKGDILLGVRATIGNFTFSDNEYCIGRGVAAIRVDENKADKGYVIKCVEKGLNEIIHTLSGSTIKGIRKEDLTEMKLNLPPLPQQQKIANILDAADALRQNDKALIAKYDELTQALFLDMFGDPVSNNLNLPFPKIRELTNVSQGMQIAIKERHKENGPNRYKYLTVAYLNGRKEEEYIESPRASVICSKDEILMIRTGNTGQVVTNVEGVFHNNFFKIDWDKKRLNKNYLVYFLSNPGIRRDLLKRASTTTIPDLSHGQFYDLNIIVPPLDLQNQFAVRVAVIEEQKAIAQKSLVKSEELFNSLLQKAFKGELV